LSADYLSTYADAGLYTMQGRISPPEDGRFQSFPRHHWRQEIRLAPLIPLRGIEWIYDAYGEGANPIETEAGRSELKSKLSEYGVRVVSICADYFMDCPLVRVPKSLVQERTAKLQWLIGISPELGIERIVLPFVDAAQMSDSKDWGDVLSVLGRVVADAEQSELELHLETDLSPGDFKSFLSAIDHPLIKVNYDSGNSASLGYSPEEEFTAYGHRIGSFHIKDRLLGGSTVPLGMGNVDFRSLRSALVDVEYRGDFVLQVARGAAGDELSWMKHVCAAAKSWLRGETAFR
jgi:L-ribulose-5-phosphate 3-epimerase